MIETKQLVNLWTLVLFCVMALVLFITYGDLVMAPFALIGYPILLVREVHKLQKVQAK